MVLGRTINLSERDCAAPVAGEVAELLAHDLRTPLNAVRGFAELLLAGAGGPLTGEGRDMLVEVAAAGRALEAAIGVAQELCEPWRDVSCGTPSPLASLLADSGFAVDAGAEEVNGDPDAWRRLLVTCRAHVEERRGGSRICASVARTPDGGLALVLGEDGDYIELPMSVLRERLIRRQAAGLGVIVVSKTPHRPLMLLVPPDRP